MPMLTAEHEATIYLEPTKEETQSTRARAPHTSHVFRLISDSVLGHPWFPDRTRRLSTCEGHHLASASCETPSNANELYDFPYTPSRRL